MLLVLAVPLEKMEAVGRAQCEHFRVQLLSQQGRIDPLASAHPLGCHLLQQHWALVAECLGKLRRREGCSLRDGRRCGRDGRAGRISLRLREPLVWHQIEGVQKLVEVVHP
jgi:hypothetical protein